MRFPNDTSFHLRMAALVVMAMFVEHLAETNLPNWSSPRIGVLPFALGLAWVGLFAWHLANLLRQRVRVLEDRLDRLTERTDNLEDERRERRSLPPLR
ncbi:MAG: hypothetical protein KDE27_04755 [Planctomycetes bacterium]|nr:hypothetical protein [Planctomycetota bacterium]